MKIKLLLSVMTVGATIAAVGGVAEVWAACVPTKDCATLGYKYTAAQCNGKGVACTFDTTRYNCANLCTYTITADTCSSQCLNVGTKSCTRGGVTYYESCGTSMCSSGKSCYNGTCYTPVAKSGYCCGYFNGCGFSGGTSSSNASNCQSYYGRSCYNQCKIYGYPDCNDMQASCRASGGTPVFQYCDYGDLYGTSLGAYFGCE